MSKVVAPEVIDLERIRLRRPTVADAEAIFEYGGDPEVAHYADWPIRTSIDSLVDSLRERATLWETGTQFSWVITLRTRDRAIGGVTCWITDATAEIGFLLHRQYWGSGYATEAARAVVEWLFSLPSVSKVRATCDTENVASIRVLEKLGLSREATLHRSVARPQISAEPRDAFVYSRTQPAEQRRA